MLFASRLGYICARPWGRPAVEVGVWSELPGPILLSGALQPPGSERQL